MDNFEFSFPTKVVFGKEVFNKIGGLSKFIGKKAFLVTGKGSLKKLGLIDKAVSLLEKEGIKVVHFEGIEPNPRVKTVDNAVSLLREEKSDFIIAFGGGSVMDAAKFISASYSNGGSSWEYVFYGNRTPRKVERALPIITIPTLAATGSEVNNGAVITNWETREKSFTSHPLLTPKVAILDPVLTLSVSKKYTADGCVDMLCHILESYLTGNNYSDVPDRLAEALISVILERSLKVLDNPGDVESRGELLWTSSLALCRITSAGRGGPFPVHEIEHSLSGHYDISHGFGLAVILPVYFEEINSVNPERLKKLGRIFNVSNEREVINKFKEWLDEIYKKAGYSKRPTLKDCNIDNSKFEVMADDVIKVYGEGKNYIAGCRNLYKNDIINIYKGCM